MKYFPTSYPRSNTMILHYDNQKLDLFQTDETLFAFAELFKSGTLEIECKEPISTVSISPKRKGILYYFDNHKVQIQVTKPINICIRINNYPPLFFYCLYPEKIESDFTYHYKSGQIYEIGNLQLFDNESVYIEYGAVVLGRITAHQAKNIRICGHGILDNSYYSFFEKNVRTISFTQCENVLIEDILLVRPTSWMILLAGCKNVSITGVREIGEVMSSDGIDIVGSQNVTISNCFLRNNDDCVVVKHCLRPEDGITELTQLLPTRDILVENCTFYNADGGNAIEIGFELNCEEVKNITFRNIDIINVGGIGAALSVHVSDQAIVSNVLFESIYIEHYYSKLIDLRVVNSMYSTSTERGHIKDIVFKNIFVDKKNYHDGYSVSVIGGYDAEHRVQNVIFDNFCFNNVPIKHLDELDLFTRHADNLVIAGNVEEETD